jgi:ketosteroid isomerase-like protein
MSQANVEIVRSVLEPLSEMNAAAVDWDADTLEELLQGSYTEDVQLKTLASGAGTGLAESYTGTAGLIEYLRGWLEPFSEYHVDNLDYIEEGDRVLVPSRQWGIGKGSGVRVELELTTAYELRDGKIARATQYDSLEEARQAADAAQ